MKNVFRYSVAAILGLAIITGTQAHSEERLTFTKDILPILQDNCITCHRPGGDNISGMVAPMSLMTYQEVRPWAKAIAKAVSTQSMPPWFATEETHGEFSNERGLSDGEIALIVKWTQTGVARGRIEDAPEPLTFESDGGWMAGTPDVIVEMNETYFVADDVEDLYVNFKSDTIHSDALPHDRWLRSIEWRGGSEVVHHIVGSASSINENGDELRFSLGSIAPGEEATHYPEGYGKRLRAGSKINFNMHYHKEAGPGTGVHDKSMVGFRFWDEKEDLPVTHVVQRNGISNRYFEIPPGHGSWEVGASKSFDVETEILALHPHMHLRGKDAKYVAVYPDGTRETLLEVPAFDFNWQLDYSYVQPKVVPAGTRVEFTVHYDNSPENEYNPDPTIPMEWGGPTTMEMMIGYISYSNSEEEVQEFFSPEDDDTD